MNSAEKDLIIRNQKGLHARAAAAFVKCIEPFAASVTVEKDGQEVDGSSILGLMMLSASQGSVVHVKAEGGDAQKALDALSQLVDSLFGEDK